MQRIRYTGDGWGEKQIKHGKVTQIIIIITQIITTITRVKDYQEKMLWL